VNLYVFILIDTIILKRITEMLFMGERKFVPIFGLFGQPLICYVCGGEIAGETYIVEQDQSIYHCDNGCMIQGR
jgi:hypothetical protein